MWHLRRIFYQIGIDLFLFVTRLLGAKPGYQQPKSLHFPLTVGTPNAYELPKNSLPLRKQLSQGATSQK